MSEVLLNEVDVQTLDLKPGQVLMVTVKHDDVSQDSLQALQRQFIKIFPDNKVLVFNVGTEGDIKLVVIDQPAAPEKKVDSCGPVGYCEDCSCGKKEAMEAKNG